MRYTSLAILLLLTGCVNYSGEVRKAVEGVFKEDLEAYTFRSTPVGTYGAGTMYFVDKYGRASPDNSWLAASTASWWKGDIPEDEKAGILKKVIAVGDFGDVSLNRTISTKLGLEATVPAIKELVSVGAGVSTERGVEVKLDALRVVNRRIDWTELQRAIKAGKISGDVAELINAHSVIIAAADIVFDGYTATVTVDDKINATLKAKLDGAAAAAIPIGKDSSVEVKVTRNENGTYTVAATKPVVAAVLYISPPGEKPINKSIDTLAQDLYLYDRVLLNSDLLKAVEDFK